MDVITYPYWDFWSYFISVKGILVSYRAGMVYSTNDWLGLALDSRDNRVSTVTHLTQSWWLDCDEKPLIFTKQDAMALWLLSSVAFNLFPSHPFSLPKSWKYYVTSRDGHPQSSLNTPQSYVLNTIKADHVVIDQVWSHGRSTFPINTDATTFSKQNTVWYQIVSTYRHENRYFSHDN